MWRTGYPQTRLHVVKSYSEFMAETEGLHTESDAHYEWRAICVNQDDELYLGRQYWGGTFHGLSFAEMRLLARWLVRWRIADWFGLRSWVYSLALNAAVHDRRPGSCQQVPPKGSGGYDHWHCQRRKGHAGPHGFRNYTWDHSGRVEHAVGPVPK
jgi:hypothetical protein